MASKTRSSKKAKKSLSQGAMWALVAVALVAGLLIGRFALVGIGSGFGAQGSDGRAVGPTAFAGVTEITADQLDDVIGVYTYKGREYDITIREVIEATTTLDAAVSEEGTYALPAADTVFSYARQEILYTQAAAELGIDPTDEEIASYALDKFGSDDFSLVASQYGVSENQARDVARSSLIQERILDELGVTIPTQPIVPTTPAEGAEEEPTAEYAQYIIDLVGNAWDAESGTWADPEGTYALALGNYEITNDSATYEAAYMAYQVAQQVYATESSAASTTLNDFYKDILSQGSVSIYTLGA